MSPKSQSRLVGAALLGVISLGTAGCGRFGPLTQPAPLFGEGAKSDYAARQAARQAQASGTAPPAKAAADQPDPDADNAPKTTRDVKAPQQNNAPISKEPIEGVPDLFAPPPSMSPPGR